ncbi:MAG: prepilin-type N-terminal cleavage/methylation domain-containing protein [gamma proteobacterium symbiont of Bathyaustriella thionipta]|nr:prepilin-type N-terminal cleavage/methylation domain-containing protein [gamma proteobacterium symbiont of Bathyaustriella thionipta]MCU7951312.1 prepilin-type N-terminal cleavage/methylation domain-containing protein [gamma proteobacterium symbiont of Bathyaustriella thionipta]MCU7952187.1 prepilin-type N-terminal cleavage/methylation domain-containing protein [gamma proteobacterium symbiont of Bathyaustriella thionipta]MCU7957867.1 prepilin-type N-terminal cleavage/methylation domain-contai
MVKHSNGFTLMELMIVMAIIALASAVIIPRIGSNDGKLYRAQLSTLTVALNYNRRSAVVMNQAFEMTLFPYSADSTHKLKKGDWASQGADIQWQSGTTKLQNKSFSINYFPQGGATEGTIKIQHGRYIAQLIIDGITGKVTVEETINDTDS